MGKENMENAQSMDKEAIRAKVEEKEGGKPTIEGAESFEELFAAIDAVGEFQGGHRKYTAEELKDRIKEVRAGIKEITVITSTGGLRAKVLELLGESEK